MSSLPEPPPPEPVFATPSPPTPSAGYVILLSVVDAFRYPPLPPTLILLALPPNPGSQNLLAINLPPPAPPPPAYATDEPVIEIEIAFPPSPALTKAVVLIDCPTLPAPPPPPLIYLLSNIYPPPPE